MGLGPQNPILGDGVALYKGSLHSAIKLQAARFVTLYKGLPLYSGTKSRMGRFCDAVQGAALVQGGKAGLGDANGLVWGPGRLQRGVLRFSSSDFRTPVSGDLVA